MSGGRRPARKWLVAFVLFILGVFLVLRRGVVRKQPVGPAPGEFVESQAFPIETQQKEARPEASPSTIREELEAFAKPATSGLVGLVVTPEGEPVPDAQIRFTSFAAEDVDREPAWFGDDWGGLEREWKATRSGVGGRFGFDELPEDSHGAVLWVTHPGHRAGAVLLGSERASWPREVRIVLEPSASIEVAVVDREGQPASGALVEQFGTTACFASCESGGMNEEQARRLLACGQTTGPDGTAVFGALPGEQVFVASRGSERSIPWRGSAQQRVILSLQPTFQVGGVVSMPAEDPDEPGERRITISAQSRNLWRPLHALRSVEAGRWGPIALPLLDVDRYRIRLEGSPIIPVEVFFEPPRSGAELDFDLVTEIGVEVRCLVSDLANGPVSGAVVRVLWQDPPDHWNFVEQGCNESGKVVVRSVPRGAVVVEARAQGYLPYRSGLEPSSVYGGPYMPITLTRAGRMTGRCLHAGEPVPDFEVLVWQPELGTNPSSTSFLDRDDGRFELDTVPEGAFWVTASSPDFSGGEPVQTSCPRGGSVEVLLDLPDGLRGRGRVADGQSGEPLPTASIQMFVKGDSTPAARWGLPRAVESDGSFDLVGFQPGSNLVRVLAPGYSNKLVERAASTRDLIDWDVLRLYRPQPFRIVLERTETGNPVEVTGWGAQVLEARSFSADNEVVFESVNEGRYMVRFEDGHETGTSVELMLAAGGNWLLRERIDGPNHLSIECRNPDGGPAPRQLLLDVSYTSSQGHRHIRSPLLRNGLCELQGIDAPTVSVQIYDYDTEETIAVSGGSFTNGQLHLVIPLEAEPFDLRIVDPEGEPLSGVRVLVMDPATPGMALFGGTDEKGECRIIGVPAHEVRVNLQHGPRSHFGIPLDASVRSAELVLDAEAALDLLLVDGETPLPGASFVILDEQGTALLGEATADSSGRAVLSGLGADHYSIRAWRSDCWPIVTRVEARVGGDPMPLQLRRVGDFEIQVHSADGLPVSDLPVRLTSVEFGVDVGEWIEAERVRSSGLATDLHGQILVERLPHGDYRWELTTPGGEPLDGRLRVEPGERGSIRLTLQE